MNGEIWRDMFHIKVALGTEKVAFTEYIKHLSSIFFKQKKVEKKDYAAFQG